MKFRLLLVTLLVLLLFSFVSKADDLNQIWDIPLGMDFEEAGKLLSEKLGMKLERKVDESDAPSEKKVNSGYPYFEADGVLLRNQAFTVDLYAGNTGNGFLVDRLVIKDIIRLSDDEDYERTAFLKCELLMKMMRDRFGDPERSVLLIKDRVFDALLDSDGRIDRPSALAIDRRYQMVFKWKNITLQLNVLKGLATIVTLTENSYENVSIPASEGVYDESKFGIQSF